MTLFKINFFILFRCEPLYSFSSWTIIFFTVVIIFFIVVSHYILYRREPSYSFSSWALIFFIVVSHHILYRRVPLYSFSSWAIKCSLLWANYNLYRREPLYSLWPSLLTVALDFIRLFRPMRDLSWKSISHALLVCLFVCLYPVNVKTAEPIWHIS